MPLGEQLAPHFARQVDARPTAPAVQRSTLDAGLQRVAIARAAPPARRADAAATSRTARCVVLDNASGEVLAWVGSSGGLSGAAQVDGVLARRQPGSTLKPFVYALAFEKRLITPASLLDDSPAQIATAQRPVPAAELRPRVQGLGQRAHRARRQPERAGGARGRDARARRAVRAAQRASAWRCPKAAATTATSLALGSADVTLLALTNAYRALANGGAAQRAVAARVRGRARRAARAWPMRRRCTSSPTSWPTTTPARAPSASTARSATRGFAAVKTGTSKDMRDNWCVGFTDRYTVGVWVGNASGEPMHERQRRQRRGAGLAGAGAASARRPAVARAGRAGGRGARARRVRRAARAGARRALHRRHRAAAAARQHADGRGAPALRHHAARATAASSRSTPTSRRPRSASASKASAAPGCSTAGGSVQGARWSLGAVAGAARLELLGRDGQPAADACASRCAARA